MSYRRPIPLHGRYEAAKQVTLYVPFVDEDGTAFVSAGEAVTCRIQKPDGSGVDATSVAWRAVGSDEIAIVLNAALVSADGNYIVAPYIAGEATERFAFQAEAAI